MRPVPEVVIQAAPGRSGPLGRGGPAHRAALRVVRGELERAGRRRARSRAAPTSSGTCRSADAARHGNALRLSARRRVVAPRAHARRARGGRRPRPFLLWLPTDAAGTAALVDASAATSDRRGGRRVGLPPLRRELGARDPRWYPVVGLLFAAAVALLVFPAIAGWDALKDGDLGALGPATLIPLALWLGPRRVAAGARPPLAQDRQLVRSATATGAAASRRCVREQRLHCCIHLCVRSDPSAARRVLLRVAELRRAA